VFFFFFLRGSARRTSDDIVTNYGTITPAILQFTPLLNPAGGGGYIYGTALNRIKQLRILPTVRTCVRFITILNAQRVVRPLRTAVQEAAIMVEK